MELFERELLRFEFLLLLDVGGGAVGFAWGRRWELLAGGRLEASDFPWVAREDPPASSVLYGSGSRSMAKT